MKKVISMMAAAALFSVSVAHAQMTEVVEVAEVPVSKYSVQTNSFWDNWFISLNAGAQFSYLYPEGKQEFKDNYANLHIDAMMNVTNMVMGYNSTRLYNMIPYIGMGGVRVFDQNTYAFGFNVGLLNTFRLNDSWRVNLEMGALLADRDMDGVPGEKRGFDNLFSLTAGITYNIGGDTWNNTPDISSLIMMNAAEIAALNDALVQEQAINRNLRNQLAQKPREVVKEKVISGDCTFAPQSIFFTLGSAKIASHKEIVNLKAIADVAKADGLKLHIVGYADSATGNAKYNQKLSLHRAQTIADELVKLGVNKANLTVEGKGGVATLNPTSYNRRVIIEAM
jgi:outer membrane protein OmpA-like peptidoglycan-associated protein